MSLDRVYVSHKNSLNIKVNFEHTRERATASALIDSGATENFIDVRTAERWRLPRKTLPRPRPIVNVDGTENKAGMVTKACILEVLHNSKQHLQRFYVTDLGFDRVLLGYPWLSTCYSSRLTLYLASLRLLLRCFTCYFLKVSVSVACDREYQLHKMDCLSRHSGSSYPT